MPSLLQQRGGQAEHRAVLFLQKNGYEILATHYTSRYGEIDVVAKDGQTIVAVEVKARRSNMFGTAAESVSKKKIQRILLTLQIFLEHHHASNTAHRIDVIAIDGTHLRLIRGIDVSEKKE